MASTKEALVKRKVVSILKANGVYYFFPATGGYGTSGVPDIVCCVNGMFLGIECKAGKNTPTKLQETAILRIKASGGVAIVVNETNIEHVINVVAALKKIEKVVL